MKQNKKEQEILKLNNPWKSYSYCLENKDANIKLHEDVIVHNKNVSCAYYFALNIPGANVERLQEIVINSNRLYYIYHFAFIENSNKQELFRAILKLGDESYINEFIENIPLSEELKELAIFI